MAKTQKKEQPLELELQYFFKAPKRFSISVPHRSLSDQFETVQGQEQSIKKLFDDYVAGRLDPRQLGGGSYDPDDSDEVDPLNTFGLTFEEASQVSDAGRKASREIERVREVADHPIESSEQHEKEDKPVT